MKDFFLIIWRYRQFIYSSIRNEFKGRFARSKLGGAWMVLNPLFLVLMYALVLSVVLSSRIEGIDNRFSFSIYLTAGMLAWSLFSEIVMRCMNIFIDNANLMKKIVFPKICLPLIVTGSVLVNNILLLFSIIGIFLVLNHYPGVNVLWLPLLFAVTIILGLGIGLILGVINVFIRDVGQVVSIVLQFAFWFTPIVYSVNIIPAKYRGLLALNPMTHVVFAFQNVLVFGRPPDWYGLSIVTVCSLILLAFGLFIFLRASAEMMDVL